jgi:hypothetical protein
VIFEKNKLVVLFKLCDETCLRVKFILFMTQIWTQVLMRMKKLCKEQKTTNMNYEHEQNKKRWKALQTRSKLMIPSSKNKWVDKTIKTFAKYTLGSWRLLQTSSKPRIQVKQILNLKTLATHMACSRNAKLKRALQLR